MADSKMYQFGTNSPVKMDDTTKWQLPKQELYASLVCPEFCWALDEVHELYNSPAFYIK